MIDINNKVEKKTPQMRCRQDDDGVGLLGGLLDERLRWCAQIAPRTLNVLTT